MLPTIAFKRRSKSSNKKTSRTNQRLADSRVSNSFRLKPWMAITLVIIVAVLGIVILRFSRASTSDVNTIPTNLSDIQTTVSSLLSKNPPPQDVSVKGYADISYTPSDQAPAKVVYYLDGKQTGLATGLPYKVTINTNQLSNSSHNLTIVSFDSSSTVIAAKQSNLIVDNPSGMLHGVQNILTYPWHALFSL